MSSSLSKLVDNLSEGIHNDKCSECKSNLDYVRITKNKKLLLKCFNCNIYYKKKFNNDLIKKFKNTYSFCNNDTTEPSSLKRINKFVLLLRKGVYPYEYIDTWERFNEKLLPSKKDFSSNLNMEDIMQSLSRKNKGIKYLLYAIDLYSKYGFVITLKDKKGISIVNAFNKIIKQSNRKPNKIWVDQGGEFYYNVFKKWLSDNDIIMYSTYNEGKSVVAERFIRTLKNKLYKHMTATGKNVYYDVLDDVVNKYNNTKHSTIKMRPIDVKDNDKRVFIDEHNEKDCRLKVGDRVRISKFRNIFAKGYTPNWSKEIFIVDKINDTVPYMYNLKDLNDEEIIGSFYNRELHKTKL